MYLLQCVACCMMLDSNTSHKRSTLSSRAPQKQRTGLLRRGRLPWGGAVLEEGFPSQLVANVADIIGKIVERDALV